jgi:hypothetical protein
MEETEIVGLLENYPQDTSIELIKSQVDDPEMREIIDRIAKSIVKSGRFYDVIVLNERKSFVSFAHALRYKLKSEQIHILTPNSKQSNGIQKPSSIPQGSNVERGMGCCILDFLAFQHIKFTNKKLPISTFAHNFVVIWNTVGVQIFLVCKAAIILIIDYFFKQ